MIISEATNESIVRIVTRLSNSQVSILDKKTVISFLETFDSHTEPRKISVW